MSNYKHFKHYYDPYDSLDVEWQNVVSKGHLTISEVVSLSGYTKNYIYHLVKDGVIPCMISMTSIGTFVYAFDGTATGVVHASEGGIPFEGDGGTAGHGGFRRDGAGGRVRRKMLGEDAAVIVFLFVLWRVDGETFGSMGHLFVSNGL